MWVVYSRSPTGNQGDMRTYSWKTFFKKMMKSSSKIIFSLPHFVHGESLILGENDLPSDPRATILICIFKFLLDGFLICIEQYNMLWFLLGSRLVVCANMQKWMHCIEDSHYKIVSLFVLPVPLCSRWVRIKGKCFAKYDPKTSTERSMMVYGIKGRGVIN